ncbi:MAG: HAD family phosphatase [Clostridia bacterium]|nr:HAD family phosphatase [Clostridia bacterium]
MRDTVKNIDAAIFDLDGTLFDSVEMWHEIDEVFLRRRGLSPTTEYRRAIVALGFTATAYFTVDYYKLKDTPEQLMDEWSEMARERYAHTVPLLAGAREYIGECENAGIKISAVTSLCAEFANSCLKNNGIDDKFAHVFTADDTGFAKTSPDIYLHAARVLGVKPEKCVVYDDAAAAIAAAKRAGMTTVAMLGPLFDAEAFGGNADYIAENLFGAPRLKK